MSSDNVPPPPAGDNSKLVPASPGTVTVIRKVTENIMTFSAPFNRFGRIKIGGRGTVVRLPSGNLAVFSPMALTAEARTRVREFGTVKYISALDAEHHIFLGPWHREYPNATVIGVEGLPEKRAKQGNEEVRFDVVYTKANKDTQKVDEEFDREFDVEYVPSHGNQELVFNFKRDRTLIQGDLLFNLPAEEQYSRSEENPHTGFLTKLFNGINHTQGSAIWQKRFIWYAISAKDRQGYNASVSKINGWDFDRIIPCHGDVIESGGQGIFQKIMGWHLDAARNQSQGNA